MKAVALALIALTGCATQTEVARTAAVEVDKVVTVRCIKEAPRRPAYRTELLPATASDVEYGDALAIDWVASRSYEREMEMAVSACLK